jgi:hypothetical protein
MAFARDVGELQSLSGVDMKLIALAHTLEKASHGYEHLHSSAPTLKVHAKMHKTSGKLPGWGTEGADWDALDKEPQDQAAGKDRGAKSMAAKHCGMCRCLLCAIFCLESANVFEARSDLASTPSGGLICNAGDQQSHIKADVEELHDSSAPATFATVAHEGDHPYICAHLRLYSLL